MPVLTIHGMPDEVVKDNGLSNLEVVLRMDVSKKLDVKADELSVFFPTNLLKRGLGKELVCFIDDLPQKSEWTSAIRRGMVVVIMRCLVEFAKHHLSQCEKIKVEDPNADGFAECDPRKV